MADPFLAEIRAFGFSFAPRGWMPCDGRQIPISQYTAVFSLLGTTYGGNGQTTFALPNLGGSALVSQGSGPGLSAYVLGEVTGTPTVTLLSTQMPAHTHAGDAKIDSTGAGNMHTNPQNGDQLSRYSPNATPPIGFGWNSPPLAPQVTLAPTMVQNAGGGLPHNNRQPYLALLYCIAMEGIFPARN